MRHSISWGGRASLRNQRSGPAAALTAGLLAGALVLTLGACGGGGDNGPVTPLSSTGTASATSSSGTATATADTPGQQKVLAANAVMGTALLRLATASRGIQTDNGAVPVARQAVTVAVNSARANLKSVRAAAYGTGKSCSSVFSHTSATRSAAGRASAAARHVTTTLNRLRGDVGRLDAAVALVRKDLTALQAAIKAEPNPPPTVTTAEVNAAISGAVTLHKATIAFVGDAQSKVAANVSAAAKAASTASSVAAKAC
jgi:hypothetical protein